MVAVNDPFLEGKTKKKTIVNRKFYSLSLLTVITKITILWIWKIGKAFLIILYLPINGDKKPIKNG